MSHTRYYILISTFLRLCVLYSVGCVCVCARLFICLRACVHIKRAIKKQKWITGEKKPNRKTKPGEKLVVVVVGRKTSSPLLFEREREKKEEEEENV